MGDELRFAAPYGRFFVRTSAQKPMLFLAGGSGLSSPKSMILDQLESGSTQPITLIHGVRTGADLYFDELFRKLEAEHDTFRYVPALSEPGPDDAGWTGETGFERIFYEVVMARPPIHSDRVAGRLLRLLFAHGASFQAME